MLLSKIAVISGASSGIGYASAKLLAQNGYIVYGLSRSKSDTDFMTEIEADVTKTPALENAVLSVLEQHGHIDLLIANAGTGLSSPAEMTDMEDARYLMNVNFFGVAEIVRLCLPHMKLMKSGKIIVVSSMAGLLPLPYENFYSASKAALCSYACSVRNEASPFGVSVSAVLPGGVRTGFTAKRKRYESLYHSSHYPGYQRAIEALSKEEQSGLYTHQVAKAIFRLAERKNMTPLVVIGGVYKVYRAMLRVLPTNMILFMLRKKYIGNSLE